MIVDPDFLEHWKTRMLVDSLCGDASAPLYVIRLWGHCQNRRTWIFDNLPPVALKAICRFSGDADALETALSSAGFIRRQENELSVCNWEEYNASLIANWKNGSRGGRPKKQPIENPPETHGFPMAKPSGTREEPIRYDEVDKNDIPPNPQGGMGDGSQANLISVPFQAERDTLPANATRLSETAKKRTKVTRNTLLMDRIGSWFGRQASTLWTIAEVQALLQISPPAPEIDGMENYYTAAETGETNIRRRDLLTLLNNWQGELDRARTFHRERSAAA